jgi:transcriptional regulator with XRE-family HTH domain
MIDEKKILEASIFGERLRYLREKAGFNQTALAKELGYKRSNSISNLETGKSPPDLQILQKIASFFNVNLHWLITGNPSPDGEAWRTDYAELLRIYHSDIGPWMELLETEIRTRTRHVTELYEKKSRGETINPFDLEMDNEQIRLKQQLLDKIKAHLKQSFDRYGGVRLEL